ncbi:M50 family metallopeptidase [Actinopolyspora mortivallis]|uniref:M50 family peptidase n=1 Tax=Actinopolyspora mortivallis TaxID=33906 RepID=A0A2T0GZ03_ACTMO|nr:M50 family metallopeptidase [Actinopolyspora mortivallis]PRW64334.1 hypothetical protein CEP50_05200 [Actinopolyspora mortivallis]
MDELGRDLSSLVDSVPAPMVGLLALVLVGYRGSWRVLRNVVTIAHEGGHAGVALLSGRKLNGIRLHSDTSGLTVSTGPAHGPGMVLTLFAGYPTVSLLGLSASGLVSRGHPETLLWAAVASLALLLVALRNLYGVLAVVVTGGVLAALAWWGDAGIRLVCAELLSWLLLLGGVRPLFELARKRRRGRAANSDADQLARLTGVAGGVWLLVWFVITVGMLLLGAGWLLEPSPLAWGRLF